MAELGQLAQALACARSIRGDDGINYTISSTLDRRTAGSQMRSRVGGSGSDRFSSHIEVYVGIVSSDSVL